jgi:tetratricopeptide (TPR) repeat protein
VHEVERLLGLSRSTILRLVAGGFVSPARGPRRAYRFSFQDLIVLKTARALALARIPGRRIGRSLRALRAQLPASVPLSGLKISAVGDQVAVHVGERRWQADSGQYLLELDVRFSRGALRVLERVAPSGGASLARGRRTPVQRRSEAQRWFERGQDLESVDSAAAVAAYERALALDPRLTAARVNLGLLHHAVGRHREAEAVYLAALDCGLPPDPMLLFNFAVLLEDLGQAHAAERRYLQALEVDPEFADAHFNLARLAELGGESQRALRHLAAYRKLVRFRR